MLSSLFVTVPLALPDALKAARVLRADGAAVDRLQRLPKLLLSAEDRLLGWLV
jgi:hypothetical protein